MISLKRALAASSILVASALAAQAPPPAQLPTMRTDLQRHDLSLSGWEALQARIDFNPGVYFPFHTHPGEEIIYVLEGTLEYEIKGKPPVTLKPGDVLFVPPETPHSARNVGSGKAAELATYIVRKDKPLLVITK